MATPRQSPDSFSFRDLSHQIDLQYPNRNDSFWRFQICPLSQKHSATDGRDLNIGETTVWRLDSWPFWKLMVFVFWKLGRGHET